MEILDWRIICGDSHSETWVLAHKDSKLYVAVKKGSLSASAIEHTDPSTWLNMKNCKPPEEFDPTNLYPAYRAEYTRFRYRKGEDSGDVYKKHQSALSVGCRRGFVAYRTDRVAQITAREVMMCERLCLHPYANIAEYRGVQTGSKLTFEYRYTPVDIPMYSERVVNLVFKRYDCNLHELVLRRQVVEVRSCLKSIVAGIQHLHGLGIIHGDIKPHNVFVECVDRESAPTRTHFVVGDFDSAHDKGSVMNLKGGTKGWVRPKVLNEDIADEDDDWHAFQKLKEWLVKAMGGRLQDYEGFGRKVKMTLD
ncbi:Nn.00g068220.m01.CDS01 [Neocucurbitaria sp. VM-36]